MSLIKVPCMQITNMHCSGQTVSLAAGDYHATIVTVGAGLAELTFQGCHLVIPHKPEEMPLAHLGKVLIPWPNRSKRKANAVCNTCSLQTKLELLLN